MKTYLVGGALRDRLLGLAVSDRDWLVVGSTPEQMVAQGYLPVGRDFPVFLHPRTREEHALARTERKSAPGYRGFVVHASPDVTVEEDLARRDLTINAIALPSELADASVLDASALVDPFQGRDDLRDKVLRHVTDAFREDPVRILRVARFAARFSDFAVAPETMALMREMVAAGEVSALVPERVWQELSRGLMEATPSRMFEVLDECDALAALLPEMPFRAGSMRVIDRAARAGAALPVRFACLVRGLGPALAPLCDRWRVPGDERELAALVDREGGCIDDSATLDAAGLMALLERCDAIRKPARFEEALTACECEALAGRDDDMSPYPPRTRLLTALGAALAVATEAVARDAQHAGAKGPQIGEAVRQARIAAISTAISPAISPAIAPKVPTR